MSYSFAFQISPGDRNTLLRLACGSVLMVCLAGSLGCFDADALIEDRRLVAMRARLEELDIGEFRVTLPRADAQNETAEKVWR